MGTVQFKLERRGSAAIVRLGGDLRVDSAPELHGPLLKNLGTEKVVLVDLAAVTYIDSAGIASLVALYRRLSQHGGGRIVLCGANPSIWNVFRTMKLDRLFPVHPTLSQALEAEGIEPVTEAVEKP